MYIYLCVCIYIYTHFHIIYKQYASIILHTNNPDLWKYLDARKCAILVFKDFPFL